MFAKRDGKDAPSFDKIDTLVGKETEIKGSIVSVGTLRLDGRVEGEISHRGDLVVGETGVVIANIKARHVAVAGMVRGDIDAEGRLEVIPSGKVFGNIKVAALVIGDGAVFRGTSEMKGDDKPPARSKPLASATD